VSTVTTLDGRTLEVRTDGPGSGPTVIFHHGTPGAPVDFGPIVDAADCTGIRVVSYARPGYAGSSDHRGRSVADAAADAVAIADALGVDRFAAVGTSGGGPHALAGGALRPDRCVAVASVAGVAPYHADGLDWAAGMGPENLEEFEYAARGFDALTGYLDGIRPQLVEVTPAEIVTALGGLLPEVDRSALSGVVGDFLAASFHRALSGGIDGWRDDDLAFVAPWGFEPADITVPVAVWQGGVDLMVPASHGAWLAATVPTAVPHLLPGHGHISLSIAELPQILRDVCALGRLSPQ
jgi:pimeloyl-ACP methyl ester carboxylesterase